MKRFTVIVLLLLILVVTGCQATGNTLSGDKPPHVYIEVDGERHPTKLGTYCGGTRCVDMARPVELLEGQDPLTVRPGAPIVLGMNFSPKPTTAHVRQMVDGKEIEVALTDQRFTAPDEPGVYYYTYGVWWQDEEDKDVSLGDAFYAFKVEVK